MHDDDSAGSALGALADEPVPMAATTVDEVIRKGKRRLRVQRVATVGGVAAVVAVIAAGTLVFRPGSPDSSVPVASRPTSTSANALAGYTPVNRTAPAAPTLAVTTTMPLPPAGTGQVPPPQSQTTITTSTKAPSPAAVIDVNTGCTILLYTPRSLTPAISTRTLSERFLSGFVKAVHRKPAGYDTNQNQSYEPKPDDVGAARLIMDDNGGEIVLDLLQHGGSADQAADAAVNVTGDCASPRQKSLPDGTILQLYPRGEKAQLLIVFGPSGRTYVLNVIPDTQWPLSEEQLATIADEVAKLG